MRRLLQDPAGQEPAGNQGRRQEQRVEGGDEAKAEDRIRDRGEGGKEQGIKDASVPDRLGQEGEGTRKRLRESRRENCSVRVRGRRSRRERRTRRAAVASKRTRKKKRSRNSFLF